MIKLLDPFKEVTMNLQGNIHGKKMNSMIFDVLSVMDMLLQQFKAAKTIYYSQKSPFARCINLT
jgi:hypothetical protein